MRKVETARFGEIEIDETDIITMPEGLLGFGDCRRFVLLEQEEFRPFVWYQSLDDPGLCFILTDPLLFFPDYTVPVRREDIAPIRLDDLSQARVLVILVVPSDPRETTANLQGPIVVNVKERLARQLVLLDERYTTRHRLADSPAVQQPGMPEGR